MTNPRILVAGIGNIFHGDDVFGVEVAHRLMVGHLPDGVEVTDFGIRSYDLAYAILDDYDATILVDATSQGGSPGTLYLIKPDLDDLVPSEGSLVDGHSMNPMTVLQLVKLFGGRPRRLFVVGCEPATLEESEDGRIGLSEPLQTAVDGAVEMVESLIKNIRDELAAKG